MHGFVCIPSVAHEGKEVAERTKINGRLKRAPLNKQHYLEGTGMTRLELAASYVTGRRSNRSELHPRMNISKSVHSVSYDDGLCQAVKSSRSIDLPCPYLGLIIHYNRGTISISFPSGCTRMAPKKRFPTAEGVGTCVRTPINRLRKLTYWISPKPSSFPSTS